MKALTEIQQRALDKFYKRAKRIGNKYAGARTMSEAPKTLNVLVDRYLLESKYIGIDYPKKIYRIREPLSVDVYINLKNGGL